MAKQIINVGAVANDGNGDPARTAFTKTNDNVTELYNKALVHSNETEMAAANIPAGVEEVRTAGYYSPAMGGGTKWYPVLSEPEHERKKQINGVWYEMGGDELSIKDFGAKGDESSEFEDTRAVIQFLQYVDRRWDAGLIYGGPTLNFPRGGYRFSQRFSINKPTRWVGCGGRDDDRTCRLQWAAGSGALALNFRTMDGETVIPNRGSEAAGSHFEGLTFCGDNTPGTHDGIYATVRFHMHNCSVQKFGRDGIRIKANAPSSGNANCWCLDYVGIHYNKRDGLSIEGADVNAAHGYALDIAGNTRWGFRNKAFLGVAIFGAHFMDNGRWMSGVRDVPGQTDMPWGVWHDPGGGLAGYYVVMAEQTEAAKVTPPGSDSTVWGLWVLDSGGSGPTPDFPAWVSGMDLMEGGSIYDYGLTSPTVYSGCYFEGSSPLIQARSPSIFINPLFGPETGLAPWSTAQVIAGHSFREPIKVQHTGGPGPAGNLVQLGARTGEDHILRVNLVDGHVMGFRLRNNDWQWESRGLDISRTFRITGPSTTFEGGTGVPQPNSVILNDWSFIGDSTISRRMSGGTGRPTATAADGEIRFNLAPAIGEPLFWSFWGGDWQPSPMTWQTSTWNPSVKNGAIKLSNNSKTATSTIDNNYVAVRGTMARSSGLLHIEFVLDNILVFGSAGVGLGTEDAPLDNYLGLDFKSFSFYLNAGAYKFYVNDAYGVAVGPPPTNGSVIALEVNFTTGKLWVAVNAGDWNNSATANPTSGDEGIDISTTIAEGRLYPMFVAIKLGDRVTIRTDASEFTRAVSTGFSPWN